MELKFKRSYWVVSPNVLNNGSEQWIKLIQEEKKVYMGWGDDSRFGICFRDKIGIGDFILVAQGANWKKRVYFGGIVASDRSYDKEKEAYYRHLTNILSKDEIESISLNFDGAAYGEANRIPAIYKLKPDTNEADKSIVLKIERLLIAEKKNFSLSEIAEWQLKNKYSNIELPALQRGFVWKVNQIETLWDSILRGYPIGSFMLSRRLDENLKIKKLFLLDGQQRATSIALGYYNPWIKKEDSIPIVWVDLNPQKKTNNHKFVIRVITQSHPWGYQREFNNNILSVADRKRALEIFRNIDKGKDKEEIIKPYVHLDLKNVFPYDSDLPVPLSFLIEISKDSDESNWKEKLTSICEKRLSTDKIFTKYINDLSYIERLQEVDDSSIWKAIQNLKLYSIPGILVEEELLKTDEEENSEDPTLFVRLNSAGTRIGGEELIYSIYKASFPSVKDLVENIGATFIAPSRVISLATRLIVAEQESRYPRPENVNSFRRRLINEDFKNKLKDFIGKSDENSKAKELFNKALTILRELQYNIPPVLIKSIIQNEPDIFLMLLQWLKIRDNMPISERERTNIIGTLTSLAWFGHNNSKYVSNSWNEIDYDDFWQKFNKKSLNNGELFYPLIKPDLLRAHLFEIIEKTMDWGIPSEEIKTQLGNYIQFNKDENYEYNKNSVINKIWKEFRSRLFKSKSLVLFAQRNYLNERFREFNQMETLEDSSTPWDWDHIYPSSWVDGRWYISSRSKVWNNCIGNFRAMALEENRSESNTLPPSKRFDDSTNEQNSSLNIDSVNPRFSNKIKERSFIIDMDTFGAKNDWKFWSQIHEPIKDNNDSGIKMHLSAISTRMCNIYEEWFDKLEISKLFD